MRIDILTLFPQMFESLNQSIIGKAVQKEIVGINIHDFRQYANNKHNKVDDEPYGGGQGMVLKVEPIANCLATIPKNKRKVILVSPQGQPFNHQKAVELSKEEHLVFLCGHYEGFDERVNQLFVDEEISIGDYVLTGGELAAQVIIDATVRLIPSVLGNANSHLQDSHANILLDHDHYTRPYEYEGLKVPEVLLSGNHAKIEDWRKLNAIKNTQNKRPDLYKKWLNQKKPNN